MRCIPTKDTGHIQYAFDVSVAIRQACCARQGLKKRESVDVRRGVAQKDRDSALYTLRIGDVESRRSHEVPYQLIGDARLQPDSGTTSTCLVEQTTRGVDAKMKKGVEVLIWAMR